MLALCVYFGKLASPVDSNQNEEVDEVEEVDDFDGLDGDPESVEL